MRKARVLTSEAVQRKAEQTYARYLPKTMLRSLGIGGKQAYLYVYGITPGGKTVYWLVGDTDKIDEADAAAVGLISGEVFEIDTRDIRKATQAIKAELLKRGQNPDVVLSRMSHTGMSEFMETLKSRLT